VVEQPGSGLLADRFAGPPEFTGLAVTEEWTG
jgi:hypothetical protein